jgi:hypothetical protein
MSFHDISSYLQTLQSRLSHFSAFEEKQIIEFAANIAKKDFINYIERQGIIAKSLISFKYLKKIKIELF